MSDRIAAIATPPGAGALAIVRVSGEGAAKLLRSVFTPDGDREWTGRAVRHGVLRDATGEVVDDGVAWFAAGPATFTGEDVAEFTGHGGVRVASRVLEAVIAAGARVAEPGEFTRRAFLNGRMDLARAEAVADLIAASTDEALRIARAQLAGGLSEKITGMREELLDSLAHVEAGVDFPDEDLHPEGNAAIASHFESIARACSTLLETFRRGRLVREGARVVIAGRPNVGKSSLLNALSGRARAIVTDEPGTTRDVVEDSVDIGGIPVTLADTAGIRDGQGAAESEGIRRSREAAQGADLLLVVFDGSAGFLPEDRRAAADVAGAPSILVANKSDLAAASADASAPALGSLATGAALAVSAKTGAGLDALRSEMARLLGGASRSEGVVITRERHRDALDRARQRLDAAAKAARAGASPDLIASDARRGLDALGEIVGAVTTEDLLGRIFEKFCVGK